MPKPRRPDNSLIESYKKGEINFEQIRESIYKTWTDEQQKEYEIKHNNRYGISITKKPMTWGNLPETKEEINDKKENENNKQEILRKKTIETLCKAIKQARNKLQSLNLKDDEIEYINNNAV